jgi:putative transcriptional regulator
MKSVITSTYRALLKQASEVDKNVALRAMLCASPIHFYDHEKREWAPFDGSHEWHASRKAVDALIRKLNGSKEWYHPPREPNHNTMRQFVQEMFRASPFSTQNMNFAFSAVKSLSHSISAATSLTDVSPAPALPVWNADNFSLMNAVAKSSVEDLSEHFIVAHPLLPGIFRHSLVLVLKHDDSGALGVIINKPLTDNKGMLTPVWSALPDQHPLFTKHLAQHPVMIGGPVGATPDSLMSLLILHNCSDVVGARCVGKSAAGDVYLNGEIDSMFEAIESGKCKPEQFVCFLGYSSWGEGQLSGEVEMGSWFCVDHGPKRTENLAQFMNESLLNSGTASFDPVNSWCDMLHTLGGEYRELTRLRGLSKFHPDDEDD